MTVNAITLEKMHRLVTDTHLRLTISLNSSQGQVMTRRILLDTEWTAPPWSDRSELMWIGLADEEGRAWYGISSEVEIDPSTNAFVAGVFRLISPDEPRMSRSQLAAAVVDFCGQADEFWAWIPKS